MARPATQRLFFALWPSPATADAIWRATANQVPKGIGRRLPPEQIHLTLAFLGSVDASMQACAEQVASQVSGEAFELVLNLPGHFPRAQVVWLGATRMPTALAALQENLVRQLTQNCGYRAEARPFTPHITLWRKVKRVDLEQNLRPIVWNVDKFALISSQTLPSGPIYTVLREWLLTGPSA